MKLQTYRATVEFCTPKGYNVSRLHNGFYAVQNHHTNVLELYSFMLLFVDVNNPSGDRFFVLVRGNDQLEEVKEEYFDLKESIFNLNVLLDFYSINNKISDELKSKLISSNLFTNEGHFVAVPALVSKNGKEVIILNSNIKIKAETINFVSDKFKELEISDDEIKVVYLPLHEEIKIEEKEEEIKEKFDPYNKEFLKELKKVCEKEDFYVSIEDKSGGYTIDDEDINIELKKHFNKDIVIYASPFWEDTDGIDFAIMDLEGDYILEENIPFNPQGTHYENAKLYISLVKNKIEEILASKDKEEETGELVNFLVELKSLGFDKDNSGLSIEESEIDEYNNYDNENTNEIKIKIDFKQKWIFLYNNTSDTEAEFDFKDYQDALSWIKEELK